MSNSHAAVPVALITGAAGGLGSACARKLHEQGHALVLLDRDPAVRELARALDTAHRPVMAVVADVAQEADIRNAVSDAVDRFAAVDVLVNVAGIHVVQEDGSGYDTTRIEASQWAQVMAINLTAPFLLMKAVLPVMRTRRHGRIVNIISRTGRMYVPGISADYVATKTGLHGLTRVVAGENASFGITANCVAPGRVDTGMATRQSRNIGQRILKSIPLGRAGTPEEVASLVAYLCSDAAAYISGAVIDINGGGFMP